MKKSAGITLVCFILVLTFFAGLKIINAQPCPSYDNDGDGYPEFATDCSVIDCNDSDPAVNPGMTEVCDGVDNNCDEIVDETRYTERVSVDSAGVEGNYASSEYISGPSISADGRYVAFHSYSNFVANDTNSKYDIFIRDRLAGQTERVSVDSSGTEGNNHSYAPSVSGDGRYIAFYSDATNLVASDTNNTRDIFIHDRQTGQTELISVNSAGAQGNGVSDGPSISEDGRYVVFASLATNLVASDTNNTRDIFVYDRQTGQTERVSVDSSGVQGNDASSSASISTDGRYVVFVSLATNLVVNDTNNTADVFIHDRQTAQTERVSVDSAGAESNYYSSRPSVSSDGRYIAFSSMASNLFTSDTNGMSDIFVHDRQTGQTRLVSVDSAGVQGNGASASASISADGHYVAFYSDSVLVSNDTNGMSDIFVHDLQTGQTRRVSIDTSGGEGNGGSSWASISSDGSTVAFTSGATNLVTNDTNGVIDVFVHTHFGVSGAWYADSDGDGYGNPNDSVPVCSQPSVYISDNTDCDDTNPAVNPGAVETLYNGLDDDCNSATIDDDIDGDGYPLATDCNDNNPAVNPSATEVCDGIDNNCNITIDEGFTDADNDGYAVCNNDCNDNDPLINPSAVEICDGIDNECDGIIDDTGETERVSVSSEGIQANSYSESPAISADGRYTAFATRADNLVIGDIHGHLDVFVHDRNTGQTEKVSVDSNGVHGDADSGEPALSEDGRYVAFASKASNLVTNDYGGYSQIFVRDRAAALTERISNGPSGMKGNGYSYSPSISSNGRYIAFHSEASNLVPGDLNGKSDVFVHDRQTGQIERVSISSAGTEGDSYSFNASISDDGRYITFYSGASNLVSDDTNGTGDVFVHDRQTGQTERVSISSAGVEGDSYSYQPSISGDGRYVAFTSLASNLVLPDVRGHGDIFIHDRQTGQTERISVDLTGNEADNSSFNPSISRDGRFIAFDSISSNLTANPVHVRSVYVHDRQMWHTELVSVDSTDVLGNSDSTYPAISSDGDFVAFRSFASNLVPDDTNYADDIFVRHRQLSWFTWRTDWDGDGFGGFSGSVIECTQPSGYVGGIPDCNDYVSSINPETYWYQDADSDGYGNPALSYQQCEQPPGYVISGTDCDDNDPTITTQFWYQDNDEDGFGNSSIYLQQCTQPGGSTSYVLDKNDYDDNDPNIGPPIKIDDAMPIYYSTLQSAYYAASSGATVKVISEVFTENLSININKSVTFSGGYDGAFTTTAGITTLSGDITISNGTLTIENFILKQ